MSAVIRALFATSLVGLCGCGEPSAGGSSSTGNALGARVLRPDGTPGVGDTVTLRRDGSDFLEPAFATRIGNAQGEVGFERIPDGRWTVEARGEHQGRLLRLRLTADSNGLVLHTDDYASISGRVRLPSNGNVGLALLVGTAQSAGLDTDGEFRFERVSPGFQQVVAIPRSDGILGKASWPATEILPGSVDTLPAASPNKTRSPAWSLAWSEDFQNLDPTRWTSDTGNGCPDLCGWGKSAMQRFTTENVLLRNNTLVLRAESTSVGWVSGQVQTRGKVQIQYGRLEVDAILPSAKGAWSLISLQGDSVGRVWPAAGALDIASLWGQRPDSLMGIAHRTDSVGDGTHPGTAFGDPRGWAGREVTYAMEWSPTEIIWLADDQVFFRIAGGAPFDHSFYLSIGLTVGGDGNGAPETNTTFEMVVEQVRLYQRTP